MKRRSHTCLGFYKYFIMMVMDDASYEGESNPVTVLKEIEEKDLIVAIGRIFSMPITLKISAGTHIN